MLYFVEVDNEGYCTNVLNNNGKVIDALKGVNVNDIKSDYAKYD